MKSIILLIGILMVYFGFSGKWRTVFAAARGQ